MAKTRGSFIYFYLYYSYWNANFFSNQRKRIGNENSPTLYFTAVPNQGAGIGHQLANWIAGYWWAKQFNVTFAHIPFSSESWESFLSFGDNEVLVSDLEKNGYRMVKIPLFKENNFEEVEVIKKIIESYRGKRVILVCEQDQNYRDQFGVIEDIRYKFYNSAIRRTEKLIFSERNYNIAIHVRRGDILSDPDNANLQMRFISADYFQNVLDQTLEIIKSNKPMHIYFFSQGIVDDFAEFSNYPNLHWCLDMTAKDSFLHMVYADVLITSKSSFSYKPALLNKNIKIVPENFWHGYPANNHWIIANKNGIIYEECKILLNKEVN